MDLNGLLVAAHLIGVLGEMRKSISGVSPGKQVKRGRGKKVLDYSHLSPDPEYQVMVHQQSTIPGRHLLEVQVHHKTDGKVGEVTGSIGNGALLMGNAELDQPHQGRGLGKAANLALLTHAYQLGARQVVGDGHTEDSAHVYRSLARTYGLNYNAQKTGRLYGPYRYDLR